MREKGKEEEEENGWEMKGKRDAVCHLRKRRHCWHASKGDAPVTTAAAVVSVQCCSMRLDVVGITNWCSSIAINITIRRRLCHRLLFSLFLLLPSAASPITYTLCHTANSLPHCFLHCHFRDCEHSVHSLQTMQGVHLSVCACACVCLCCLSCRFCFPVFALARSYTLHTSHLSDVCLCG